MSGTASRFQGRFGYAPSLRAGMYPGVMPGQLPPAMGQPAPPAPVAPAAQPEAPPVMAGSQPAAEGANVGGMTDPMSRSSGSLSGDLAGLSGLMGFGSGVPGASGATSAALSGFSPAGVEAVADLNAAISAGAGPEAPGWSDYAAPLSASDFGGFGTAADNAAADAMGSGTGGFGATDSSENGGFGGESQFMGGGYTGPGHPAEPAGTVHRNEVVIPAAMVARYGLSPLMALVRGEVPPSRLAALARD